MRLRSPLKQVGKRALRWAAWRRKNYGLLALRCRGVCEGCGSRAPLDPHHVFGRQDEPFSSHVSMLAGLCRDCHNQITGMPWSGINSDLARKVNSAADERRRKTFPWPEGEFYIDLHNYYEYDESSNSIVRKDT